MSRKLFTLVLLLLPLVVAAQSSETPPVAYTYHQASGNRLVTLTGAAFPDSALTEIQFYAVPRWVVGGLSNGDPAWVVTLADGRVFAVQTTNVENNVEAVAVQLGQLAPGAPLAAQFNAGALPTLLTAGDDLSPLSHPVLVGGESRIYIATNGDVVLWRDGQTLDRQTVNALPDARPVVSADGLIAVYTDATDQRYVHGIMGDELEAASLTVFTFADDALTVATQITLPGEDVFEGLSPLWADLDDDDTPELITTVSNGQEGAWLRAYTADGTVFAESTSIGQGFRWRHQIAVAPFGINGETQLVDVRTPHLGGMPEFFTLRGDELSVNNAQLGYTSHPINSRNLDMGLAGDFDGDGKPELVITDPPRQAITALINTQQGVQLAWSLPLDGTLTTNLAAVALPGGGAALAAGTTNNMLRVWTDASE